MHDVRRDYELCYLVALLLVWGLFEFGVNWMMVKCGAMRMGGASCAIICIPSCGICMLYASFIGIGYGRLIGLD